MKTPYRYSLQLDNGQWYAIENGNVTTQATPFYMYSGAGIVNWRDIKITDSRNLRMAGFFRNRTNELQFVLGMSKILRHAKNTRGILHPVSLYIDRLNSTNQEYEPEGRSEINLVQSRDTRDQVAAYLTEAGVPELIKTREDTKYDIPITGSQALQVKVLPQFVRGSVTYTSVTPQDEGPVVPNRSTDRFNMLGYAKLKEELIEVTEVSNLRPVDCFDVMATNLAMSGGAVTSVEFGQPYQERPDILTNGIVKVVNTTGTVVDYFLKANVALERVSMKGQINIYLKNAHSTSAVDFRINLYQTLLSNGNTTLVGSGSTTTVTVPAASDLVHTFTFNETNFSLAANSVLYVALENMTPSIVEVEYMVQGGMPLVISFEHRTSEYITSGYNALVMATKIIDKITDGAVVFDSELLFQSISYAQGIDCRPDCLLITSTQALQSVSSPVITLSLKDLLTSLSVWLGCGLGILRSAISQAYMLIRIEDWSYFYKEEKFPGVVNVIADFDSWENNFEYSPAEDLIFSELVIGYDLTDVNSLNVKDDVHITNRYTSKYSKVSNVKEMISPIHASPFAMYEERLKAFRQDEKPSKQLNRAFVIQYKPVSTSGVFTALYPKDITSAPSISGLTDPDRLLNPGLTPTRCAYRSAYYFLSHLPYTSEFINDDYVLEFQTSERYTSLVSRMSTWYFISERADIDLEVACLQTGRQRLFYPEYINWTAPSFENYLKQWEFNRHGIFRLATGKADHPYVSVFPIESANKTAVNGTFTFKGLLTANNNPSIFIR